MHGAGAVSATRRGTRRMKFDIYGRFRLDVVREAERWVVYRQGVGTREPDRTLLLPSELAIDDIAGFLDDLLHEYARPGQSITRLD